MANLAERRRLRNKQKRVQKTAKLGSGARFKAVEAAAKAGGAKNPAAVAAAVGRKKYGKKRFQKLAEKGKSPAASRNPGVVTFQKEWYF